ncbi:MAG TPA: type II toxin-antitoxin system VapC family toxin [Gemmatimonadales bacterium]|nr:type II toxin-antitoxin system VapC family toxin [Gemmatimonadales bacterium]
MILPDVNVLVYAFREEAAHHTRYREWLLARVAGREAFALSELVLSGALRILTHPRVLDPPTPLDRALEFVEALRLQPNAVLLSPGPRHWDIFTNLCKAAGARGNLVADAYHAALAIEHGCEWISTDRDYTRFPGLKWRHPLD